jgi:hypothetical protein
MHEAPIELESKFWIRINAFWPNQGLGYKVLKTRNGYLNTLGQKEMHNFEFKKQNLKNINIFWPNQGLGYKVLKTRSGYLNTLGQILKKHFDALTSKTKSEKINIFWPHQDCGYKVLKTQWK